jgi:hypothetical protein
MLGDLTRRETIEQVRRAVLSLPAVYREVVVLCDLQDLSYDDAAMALIVRSDRAVAAESGRGMPRRSWAKTLSNGRLRRAKERWHETEDEIQPDLRNALTLCAMPIAALKHRPRGIAAAAAFKKQRKSLMEKAWPRWRSPRARLAIALGTARRDENDSAGDCSGYSGGCPFGGSSCCRDATSRANGGWRTKRGARSKLVRRRVRSRPISSAGGLCPPSDGAN